MSPLEGIIIIKKKQFVYAIIIIRDKLIFFGYYLYNILNIISLQLLLQMTFYLYSGALWR